MMRQSERGETQQTQHWAVRYPDRAVAILFAIAAYVPMLLTSPGQVSADTKSYLTIDPGRLLGQATSMWDPSVGAGTVPHQNIGYLFPLGPYYWLMDAVGSPDWIAQRLVWGTLAFAASYGTYRLVRWLGWAPAASLVAGFAYGFSPYVLSYLARLSVILGPWAALPWMILLAAKSARTRSWRPAAAFALVVALVGSVNATSLVLAGLGPILWLVTDVVSGRVRFRNAAIGSLKIGVLSLAVSAWWIAGLRIQGQYGLPILRYTETYQAVASSSTPPEVLRGLGYWFFYGGDRLDPWVGPSRPYINHPLVIALGFLIAGLSLLGFVRVFIGRATAALLLIVGMVVSVGAAPLGGSTLYGSLFESFATDSTVGAALRSTPRAAPLVTLALAIGFGATVQHATWWRRDRTVGAGGTARWDFAIPLVALVLLMAQMFPWFSGSAASDSLLRDDALPGYQTELADWLNADGDGRIYALPGADFASYRWGGTVDPVLPGLTDRDVLYRELVPQGGAATADLLNAFERRLSEGWFEPEALAPFAGLFNVDTVVVRNDLEHERYRLTRPGPLWTDVTEALGDPAHAGPLVGDAPEIPLVDAITLSRPDTAIEFPVVAAFDTAAGDASEVSLRSAANPMVVAGSGDGLVDLAGAGLLDPTRPIVYANTLADERAAGRDVASVIGADTWWVVTDTNRKQGRHWSTIGSNLGALETQSPLVLDEDPGDNDLDVFANVSASEQTIAVHRSEVTATRASYYGNRIAYTPEDAPWFAIDGDPTTAWRAGVFDAAVGLRWEVDLAQPAPESTLTLLQPVTGVTSRFMTEVRITLDSGESIDVALDERSRTIPGQPIDLPSSGFNGLSIEVLNDSLGDLATFAGQPGVGFAEITVPGISDDRVVRMPQLTSSQFFTEAAEPTQRLTYVMTRQRLDPATPNRTAPETHLVREFEVSGDGAFTISGEARFAAGATDEVLAAVLAERAQASNRLPGVIQARAGAVIDGDIDTAWTTPFDEARGATISIGRPAGATDMTITWLDDPNHSTPSVLSIDGDVVDAYGPAMRADGDLRTVALPLADSDADVVRITIDEINERTVPEYFSGVLQTLPVAVAEVTFDVIDPAAQPGTAAPGSVAVSCRSDLLQVDNTPLPVRILSRGGSVRDEMVIESCGDPLVLTPGVHRITTAPGTLTGVDVDRLLLDRPAVAGERDTSAGSIAVSVIDQTSTELTAAVASSVEPVWLTLAQSWNAGWTASIDGADLGPPVLVDGYANGWLLPPSASERRIELRWTPQRSISVGLAISAASALLIIGLLVVPRRRKGSPEAGVAADFDEEQGGEGRTRQLVATTLRRAAHSRAGVAVFVVALSISAGPLAAAAGLVVWLVGHRYQWLAPLVVAIVGGIVAAGIVGLEWRRDYADGPDWPSRFDWAAPLTWIVIAVVVATALRPGQVVAPVRSSSSPSPEG